MDKSNGILMAVVAACILISASAFVLVGSPAKEARDNDVLTQISVQDTLREGDFYGSITVGDLMKYGNIGFGSFDALEGEMIVLDGVCYQVVTDGASMSVRVADNSTTVPFACITSLDAEYRTEFLSIDSVSDLKDRLNTYISTSSPNYIYVGTIKATFENIELRTEKAQEEPYGTMADVVDDYYAETFHNVSGTLVAVYFPSYISGVNSSGWHFHFISDDATIGGHVNSCNGGPAVVILDKTTGYDIILPKGEKFQEIVL